MIKLPFHVKNHGDLVFKAFDQKNKRLSVRLKDVEFDFGMRATPTNDMLISVDGDRHNIVDIQNVYEIRGNLTRSLRLRIYD